MQNLCFKVKLLCEHCVNIHVFTEQFNNKEYLCRVYYGFLFLGCCCGVSSSVHARFPNVVSSSWVFVLPAPVQYIGKGKAPMVSEEYCMALV